MPIILVSEENTISFPPIINSTLTTVTPNTKNILIEVTGMDKDAAEDMLIRRIAGLIHVEDRDRIEAKQRVLKKLNN